MTTQTVAPPQPIPKRSKRRWYVGGGFALCLLAAPFVYLLVIGQWREHELEQIYRELDADDPNWRWDDLVKQLPVAAPNERNSMTQVMKVAAMVDLPPFQRPFGNTLPTPINCRLTSKSEKALREALAALAPNALQEAHKIKDMPKGPLAIDQSIIALNFEFPKMEILNVASVLQHDALMRAQDDKMNEAVDACLAIAHSANAMGDFPGPYAQMNRTGAASRAVAAIERTLAQGIVEGKRLESLQNTLAIESDHNGAYNALRGTRAIMHAAYLAFREGDGSSGIEITRKTQLRIGVFPLISGARLGDYSVHLRVLNEMVRASQLKDEEARNEAIHKIQARDPEIADRLLLAFFAEQVHSQRLRCAVAALAAERYRLRFGVWPMKTADLVKAALLTEWPKDIFDGLPLRSRRTATGFVVYSVGVNKLDNQGKIQRDGHPPHGTNIGFELWDRQLRAAAAGGGREMTTQTAAPPMPTPQRSKRRWYIVGGFALCLLATPFVYLLTASILRDRELEQLYREMGADDPNWRWPDLLAETPDLPDEQNAIVQIRKVDDLLKKSAFVIAPAWHTAANEKVREVRNARLSPENAELLRAAFKALDPKTLSEVRKLKNFPKGQIKIDPALNPYFEVFTGDEVQRARKSMVLLDGEIMLRTHDIDMENAAESWRALLHASRTMNANPTLIFQLQRMDGQQLAVAALERLIGQGELSEADLANIQALLKRESNDNLLHHGLRGERAASHQMYLDLRDGKSPITMDKILSEMPTNYWERPGDRMPGALNKGYPEHLRILNEYVKASTSKEEDRLETMRKIDQKAFANRNSFMTKFSMPATKKSAETFHRTQAQLRCAMAAVAAERYRLKHDAWPQGLDDLLKDRVLDEIPADPFDGKLLRFKRTATGVIIYSVGLDKIDNQGQLNRSTPLAPASDIGFEMWDLQHRAVLPPVEEEK